MKIGDLVRYDTTRYDPLHPNAAELGVVIKVYHAVGGRVVDSLAGLNWSRQMVDVSFPYGVVADDSYEFEVISEDR